MIAPCVACGAELKLAGRQQPHCLTDECNHGYAVHLALTNTVRQGECEVWQGTVKVARGFRTAVIRVVTQRNPDQRQDYRALALRDPDRDEATHRIYDNLCGTRDCVTLAHHRLRKQEVVAPREAGPRLPAEPLLAAYDAHLIRIGGAGRVAERHYYLAKKARRSGHLSLLEVDEFCIDALKVHPTAVYGEEFYTA